MFSSHFVIWLFLALAHLLLPVGLFRYRAAHKVEHARHVTVIYGGLTAAWGLSGALTVLAELAPAAGELASLVFSGLSSAIAGLAVTLEIAFAREDDNRRWGILGSGWGALVFIAGLYSRRSGNVPWLSGTMAILGWAGLWAALMVIWVKQYVRTEWAFRRNRALYWMWASALLLVGQALAMFTAWSVGYFGLLLHLGGLTAIAAAITRRELPNVRAALRQGISFFTLTLLTAVLLLLSMLMLFPLFRTQTLELAAIGLATVVAVGLAFAYGPLQDVVARLAERLVPRTGTDLDEKLREYSLAIGNIIDLEQLAAVAAGTVSEVLDVQRAALVLVTEEGNKIRLRPLRGMGNIPQEEVSFSIHSPVIEHMMGRQQKPLFQHNLEQDTAFQNLLPKVRAWLQEMGMEIYVPIFAQSIFLGILAAGPPRRGEPFGQQEQAFLTTLAHQTAIALQNARMFDDMRELNFEIIQLNEELRRAMERVERMDQAKTDFLTVASHELRTPLTHVKGYANLLAELCDTRAVTTEQTAEITCSIGQAADRLETVVKAMIDLSQLEVDELDMFFVPTTLEAVMRIALEPWMKPIQLRRLHLAVQGVDGIPPIVADLQRLSQAFSNLVSNAIKYTPDGGNIAIHAWQMDNANFGVVVSDTGVGIDPIDQGLIFNKFFRAGNSDLYSSGEYNFKGGGPGLGLSIARGVIEAHGGRMWVVSEGYDEVRCPGSAFHVVLPLQARPPAAEPSATGKVTPFTTAPEEF
ncbi:MAG: HAMP domain-containing sensor histidine kinase [Chloroflexota bacterium]|nr:HAMP domain-containing sensor histidine kinase [Chloroflexota bacterium]